MKFFALGIKECAKDWFMKLGKGTSVPFSDFLEAF